MNVVEREKIPDDSLSPPLDESFFENILLIIRSAIETN